MRRRRAAAIRKWRPHLIEAGSIWAVTRAGFLLVGAAAAFLFPRDEARVHAAYYTGWGSWDAGYFLRIAEKGYGSQPNDIAFFPLYPLGVRLLDFVLPGDVVVAGVVLSAIASLIAFVILHRLAEERVGPGAGGIAVTATALYPWGGPFLVAAYAEATFLALAVAAWYLATRSRLIPAAVFAGLAAVTKPLGVFLLLGLAVEALRHRGLAWSRVLAAGVAAIPFGVWVWWQERALGDPLAFLRAQSEGWNRRVVAPWNALSTTFHAMTHTSVRAYALAWGVEILAVAAGLVGTVLFVRRAWWGEAAFVGSAVAFQAVNWFYLSIPRTLAVLFPLSMVLAAVLRKRPGLRFGLGLLAAQMSAITAAAFVRFIWVN